MERIIRLAIFGATGMAGREALLLQALLEREHPYAEITCVTASPKNKGRSLGEVVDEKEAALKTLYLFWVPLECPEGLAGLELDELDPDNLQFIRDKADFAISALDGSLADVVEPGLARLGMHIFSNASPHRWGYREGGVTVYPVPLLVPEVNYSDISLVEQQPYDGKLACNPNCTVAGFVPVIHALGSRYRIKGVGLVTQQSISGKGDAIADPEYAARILGSVIDDWTKYGENGEERKTFHEPNKILGRVQTLEELEIEAQKVRNGEPSDLLTIIPQTTRVATQYGHLEHLTIEFEEPVDIEQIRQQLENYEIPEEVSLLPTTRLLDNPKKLFYFTDGNVMPETRRDVTIGNGMAIVIGDLQQHTPTTITLTTLSNNLRRGATWAGRQGLELYLGRYTNVLDAYR